MENGPKAPVLVSWQEKGKDAVVEVDGKTLRISDGFAVVWACAGKLLFRFLIDGSYRNSSQYPTVVENGFEYNFLVVNELPDEISQIQHLSVKELEIIDEEIFGKEPESNLKAPKVNDYFKVSAETIYSALKMNVERRKYLKTRKLIVKIQALARGYLIRTKYKNLFKRLRKSILLNKRLAGVKLPIKTLPNRPHTKNPRKKLPMFSEFKSKIISRMYRLSLRVKNFPTDQQLPNFSENVS